MAINNQQLIEVLTTASWRYGYNSARYEDGQPRRLETLRAQEEEKRLKGEVMQRLAAASVLQTALEALVAAIEKCETVEDWWLLTSGDAMRQARHVLKETEGTGE